MTRQTRQYEDSDKKAPEHENTGNRETLEESKIICRCEEVSKKTLLEMIKLMISDLAFWKKTKGQK